MDSKDRSFDNYDEIKTFQDHSVFYTERKDKRGIFDKWLRKVPDMSIDFVEEILWQEDESLEYIKRNFRDKEYGIL